MVMKPEKCLCSMFFFCFFLSFFGEIYVEFCLSNCPIEYVAIKLFSQSSLAILSGQDPLKRGFSV